MLANLTLDAHAELGEGSIWDYRTKQLYWVDILKCELHRFTPGTGADEVFPVGQFVGTVVPCLSGGVVIALKDGIHHLDTQTGVTRLLADTERNETGNRFNDGKCDPQGRFWVGSTSLNCDVPGAGNLYCMDTDHSVRQMLTGLTISNGLVWTEDGKTMYFIDTAAQAVWGFDFNSRTGEITRKRTVVAIPESEGFPDGMSIDSRGMLWIALFGGGKVSCYDPGTGQKLAEVQVPASRVTSCAFGGEFLDQLYITTARMGLDEAALAREPLAGGLFVAKPGATGIKASLFGG
jgi:sugar lactone lactonase YvrE